MNGAPRQTLAQQQAIRRYREVQAMGRQRSARSELRAQIREPVVRFPSPPGVPGSEPQPAAWVGSFPFLIGLGVVAGSLFALAMQGWLP